MFFLMFVAAVFSLGFLAGTAWAAYWSRAVAQSHLVDEQLHSEARARARAIARAMHAHDEMARAKREAETRQALIEQSANVVPFTGIGRGQE